MDKIKTATGKEFECEFVSEIQAPSRLYLRLRNASLAAVAEVFSDPQEVAQLLVGDLRFMQYTTLIAIIPEAGAVRVVLSKE